MGFGRVATAALVGATVVAGYGVATDWQVPSAVSASVVRYAQVRPGFDGGFDEPAVAAIAMRSVVDIRVSVEPLGLTGFGTGIILTPDGYVLTCHHVIKGGKTITVTPVATQQAYSASVVGYDSSHDTAVLKLDGADGLIPGRIADSNRIAVHDKVIAIGNTGVAEMPQRSVSGEVVSLSKSILARNEADWSRKQLTDLVEFDADVAPGQSGGPVVNRSGQVIGMITAAAGVTEEHPVGTDGFAVPINQAMAIVDAIRNGKPTDDIHIGPTAVLGALVSGDRTTRGARVDAALYGSPAYEAGLREGDVVTAVDEHEIESPNQLRAVLSRHRPNDTVRVAWTLASGGTKVADIVLDEGTPN